MRDLTQLEKYLKEFYKFSPSTLSKTKGKLISIRLTTHHTFDFPICFDSHSSIKIDFAL